MRRAFLALLCVVLPTAALASSEGVHLDTPYINLDDEASLQRGTKYFVNYCLSCHSAGLMRYGRMGADLGLTDQQVKENLMFTAEKVGETMATAMRAEDAQRWFGVTPPDLSLIARARGADWLYTYLRTFYLDEARPFGVNNLVFPDAAMPHVLWKLQGLLKPVYRTHTNTEGHEERVIERLEQAQPGVLSPEQYDGVVRDLVNFMVYMGEPAKMQRQEVGIWVLLYLAVFGIVAYAMKREYWKDVH
jgi:ubiquinol-cytochrome c reductase cytochrome c1 subunit